MWVHDEGLYLYPVNPIATHIAWSEIGQGQMFHGPTVFTGGVGDDGSTLPLEGDAERRVRAALALFQTEGAL